jgi:hypothetical protein
VTTSGVDERFLSRRARLILIIHSFIQFIHPCLHSSALGFNEMPTKAQCWVVSYSRARDGTTRSPSAEGLLAVPRESSIIMLHTHPDGARLAHAPYVVGLSPGRRVQVGDYECELLMLSPHGGGGNPAYAAAFCLPGEILPSLTQKNGDEGWLSWLGLDDDFDYDEPVQLRAPQLPHANDPQPTSPIPFGYGGDYVVRASERSTVRMTTSNGQVHMQAYMSRTNQSRQMPPAEPSRTTPVDLLLPPECVNPERREGHRTDAPRRSPLAAPRATVFEEDLFREGEDEEAFQCQIRFGTESTKPVVASRTECHRHSPKGTVDDMEALRQKLRELERLTGLTAEQAERELKNAEETREADETKEVEETKEGDSATSTAIELVRHREVEIEVPNVSVSSNIFKANEEKTQVRGGATLVGTPFDSPSSLRVERTAEMIKESVPSVTPEEVNANDAWVAAIARRNRSFAESVNDSSDDEFTSSSSCAKPVIQRISIAKGQNKKSDPDASCAADATVNGDIEEPPSFGHGSVAARASVFGEQVRRGSSD